jgi:hypothetical protein
VSTNFSIEKLCYANKMDLVISSVLSLWALAMVYEPSFLFLPLCIPNILISCNAKIKHELEITIHICSGYLNAYKEVSFS